MSTNDIHRIAYESVNLKPIIGHTELVENKLSEHISATSVPYHPTFSTFPDSPTHKIPNSPINSTFFFNQILYIFQLKDKKVKKVKGSLPFTKLINSFKPNLPSSNMGRCFWTSSLMWRRARWFFSGMPNGLMGR